jgi:predicted kinase
MEAIMTIGLPASGKTTYIKPYAERMGYRYICPDEIRQELTGDARDKSRDLEVWELVHERSKKALSEGKKVVVDSTFTNQAKRRAFIGFLRSVGATRVLGVFADVPFQIAQARNSARERVVPDVGMREKNNELVSEPPTLKDGFDALVTLVQDFE